MADVRERERKNFLMNKQLLVSRFCSLLALRLGVNMAPGKARIHERQGRSILGTESPLIP